MAEGNTSTGADNNMQTTKHGQVYTGELPNEFLRMPNMQDQVTRDGQIAQQMAAQEVQQQRMAHQHPTVAVDRLFISVMEAKLNKNYGVVRMDPYCRIRISHNVYETDTAYNGAKNPHWTKSISVPYNPQIETIYVEVFDERALSTDSRIAWTDVTVPAKVKNGEQADDWYPLTGKLGEELEGTIHLVISKKKVQQQVSAASMMPPYAVAPTYMQMPTQTYYAPTGMPAYYPPQQQQQQQQQQQPQLQQQQQQQAVQQGPMFTDEDVKQMKELFPNMDEEAIKTVLEASRGNKDAAINSLLSMQ